MDDARQLVEGEVNVLDFLERTDIENVSAFNFHHHGKGLRAAVTLKLVIEFDVGVVAGEEVDKTGADPDAARFVAGIGSDREQNDPD